MGNTLALFAQPNLEQYDNKKVHFGFTLAANSGRLLIHHKPDFFAADTLKNVSAINFPGLGLGAITNFRLGEYFDLRLMAPVISFVQRNLEYEFENVKKVVKVESAYCDGSLLLKYKSQRRKNTRVYVIGGGRLSYDFASTINKQRGLQNPVVSLVPITYGWEAGAGLDIYFEYFKFSPEIKLCSTVNNAMYRDGFIFTNAIDRMIPQLVQISLHFE
ncbi:MAG: outer membrane beta-barrel protein [Bacteroidia bacterium]